MEEDNKVEVVVDLSAVKKEIDSIKADVKSIAEALPKEEGKGIVETSTEPEYDYRKDAVNFLKSRHIDLRKFQEALGPVSPGSAIPEIWSTDIEKTSLYPASAFLGAGFVNWKTDVKGRPGDTVNVPTVAPVSAVELVSGTEGTTTAAAVSSVPVVLTNRAHAYYITKDDLEDVVEGTVDALNDQSGRSIAQAVDQYFLERIMASDNNAGAGTITEAGAMAATCLAKLWGSIRAGTYEPAVVLMHPVPYSSLLQDSQFTSAAEFGDRGVIASGRIPQYLGMQIIPMVQGTLEYGAAASGTYRTYMMAKGALVGAMKRGLTIEKEYYVKDQRQYTAVSIRFGGTVVHTNGIGLLLTVG